MKKREIYFRADGNAQIGLGHVVRSLALAEMLREDFNCHFIIRIPIPSIKAQILTVCQTIISLPSTTNDLKEATIILDVLASRTSTIIFDGYHFITDYQKAFKIKGWRIACIDDIHAYPFVADLVINHAGGISPLDYDVAPYTEFCLGLTYALLRKPFRLAAQNRTKRILDHNNAVFICFGGADPKNDTLKVLQACKEKATLNKYYVVLGAAYSHQDQLTTFIQESSLNITLLSNLDAAQMVHYMNLCTVAITAPSTISIEYLSVGGLLYLKKTAENQTGICNYLLAEGLAFDWTKFPVLDKNSIEKALEIQAKHFTGKTKNIFVHQFKKLNNNATYLSIS